MTGCINGQTDERAVGGAIGPGKPGLERVLGLAQRRSGPQFEDARRYSTQNAWILPPGDYTGTRRVRRCCRAKSYGKCRIREVGETGLTKKIGPDNKKKETFALFDDRNILRAVKPDPLIRQRLIRWICYHRLLSLARHGCDGQLKP
jgi:hypothetical protein